MSYIASVRRYEEMKYARCGNSGLLLPRVSLGLWHNFGATGNFDNMRRMCFTAFDLGITHFDLADNYGPAPGEAERNFGRILREDLHAYRDELVISTKAGYLMWDGPYGDFGSRKHILSGLDQSLARLGIPYVDIFYHHRPDTDTPLEETMLALSDAVRQGKALYAGLSNYGGERLLEAAKILEELRCLFIIGQYRFSIFDRTAETCGAADALIKAKKGMIVFSPLAQGLLTDRYLNGVPKDSRVRTDGRYLKDSALTKERLAQIEKLNDIARARGQKLSQMALQWCLHHGFVTSVLIGASKPEQIADNVRAASGPEFEAGELQMIDQIAFGE